MSARSSRKPSRREQVVETAEKLFSERGFTATGVDDIGAAAGVTGPAIYYYFNTKHDLLGAVLGRLSENVRARSAEIAADTDRDAAAVLEQLVRVHVDHVFDHRSLISLYVAESAGITAEALGPSRATERAMIDIWSRALRRVRPDVNPKAARLLVFAAQWLAYGVSFSNLADTPVVRARYAAMTLGVLRSSFG